MALIGATELANVDDHLAGWGIKVVMDGFAEHGHDVVFASDPSTLSPAVWLVSLPYAGNAWMVRDFFEAIGQPMGKSERGKDAPVFILGGHGVINPEPFVDIFDAVFIGEADDQLGALSAACLDRGELAAVPGVAVDDSAPVVWQIASTLDRRKPYYSAGKAGVGATTYIEVARGCRAGCRFCELGWLYGYTERSKAEALGLLGDAEDPMSVVLSAPDTDGVAWMNDAISTGEYRPRWRSTRTVPYLRSRQSAPDARRGKIRFGVEGVTERLRKLTGKYMSNEQLERAVHRSQAEGYRMVRLFLIAGLPTETSEDRMQIREIVEMLKRAPLRHWKSADIKITGLSPQPLTPWQRVGIGNALEGVREYRSLRASMQRRDPYWRALMVDAGNTFADVVKRMRRGELLRLLSEDGAIGSARQPAIRALCERHGFDYRGRVMDDTRPWDSLPWDRVEHPHQDRISAGIAAWERQRGGGA